jgi:hypothetical protein
MTSADFTYEIDVKEILGAPIGRHRYAANIINVERREADGPVVNLPSPIIECYGENFHEAGQKARAKMDAWIATQGSISVTVEARLVDGGAQDWVFGPSFLAKLSSLDVQGVTGKKLIHELLTDDWAAPPVVILISWTDANGRFAERKIPYD